MLDKARLGTRYTCFKCGTKFYDLNRPVPSCPDCSVDQREAPPRDIRSLLGSRGPVRRYTEEEEEIEGIEPEGEEDEMSLLGGIEEEEEEEDVEIEEDEELGEEAAPSGEEED